MIAALALAAGSALLGGALALLARKSPRLLERARTFAFAAAAGVVGLHLLPDVLQAAGSRALVWVAAGFALPWVLEAGAHALGPGFLARHQHGGERLAAEVGLAALLFHSVVEGVTLWAALQSRDQRVDLEVAIVAHHAPLTAAVALPFLGLVGPRGTLLRVLLAAAAGAAGVLAGSLLPGVSQMPLDRLLLPASAATAGVLLHVAFDEIAEQRFASRGERWADAGACAAGIAVAAAAGLFHARDSELIARFSRSALDLGLAAAPALLAGSLAGALRLRLPGPALGVDVLVLTARWFGALALLVRAAASALALLAGRSAPVDPSRRELVPALLEDVRRRAPWLLAALALASAFDVLLGPTADWMHIAAPAAVALVAALIPDGAGPAVATIFAAVLAGKGVPPWALLGALTAGSTAGRSARSIGLAVVAGIAAAVALRWLGAGGPLRPAPGPVDAAAAAIWSALLIATIWDAGVRGWLLPLRRAIR